MILASQPASDVVNASATATTASLVSIPGGRWLSADVQLSAALTVNGTCTPHLDFNVPGGTSGAAPANGSVLARISVSVATLALTSVADSNTTEIYVYGGDNGCTLDFTAGASGTSSITINGFLI